MEDKIAKEQERRDEQFKDLERRKALALKARAPSPPAPRSLRVSVCTVPHTSDGSGLRTIPTSTKFARATCDVGGLNSVAAWVTRCLLMVLAC